MDHLINVLKILGCLKNMLNFLIRYNKDISFFLIVWGNFVHFFKVFIYFFYLPIVLGYSISYYCFCGTGIVIYYQKLSHRNIINNNYHICLVSEMYILQKLCYMRISIPAIQFCYGSVTFSREHLKRSYVKNTEFMSQHLLQPPIMSSGPLYHLRVCLFEENHCMPCYFKDAYYSTKLVAVIFVWKILCICSDRINSWLMY